MSIGQIGRMGISLVPAVAVAAAKVVPSLK